MRMKLFAGAAIVALTVPGAAFAQSTGTLEFENNDIVVTGQRTQQVDGTKIPDTGKTKVQLTNQFLSRETPGQSVDETINMLPGVSFNNNDGYGASGGSLSIRGFDASRILQTVDGVPLNDSGNYAIYSNQQVDPELIDQVNVGLGSVDIDSPSASASGSTVAFTTITPTDDFGARLDASVGDQNMFRVFGLVNTGVFTPWGTKAWISASHQDYNVVYNPIGKIKKAQYNFKVYQPVGNNGDFVALAGNYNVNRNNNTNDIYYDEFFPLSKSQRDLGLQRCTVDVPQAGIPDSPNKCGTSYAEGLNPSNTGNLRLTSSFHLADNLILSVDPTFQYVKANGGGNTVTGFEGTSPTGQLGYVSYYTYNDAGKINRTSSGYFFGKDLNGDGDVLDTLTCKTTNAQGECTSYNSSYGVNLHGPSQTVTHRYTVISSLQWNIAEGQSLRLAYTHDYARHRQDGPLGYLQNNGQAFQPFPINDPITAANGAIVEKRNRKSFAILDQVGVEYRGNFFDDKLRLDAGGTYKILRRDLNQYCFTTGGNGYVDCIAGDQADYTAYAASHPTATPPISANLVYKKFLPAANLTYNFTPRFQAYVSYQEGEQVPGTDNLYNALYFYGTDQFVNPTPETSHNFDAGLRYTTSNVQAFVGPWLTIFNNRLASSYDPITDITTYRNLGAVHKYGVDGSVAYQPIREVSLYVFGSYLKSEIQDNVQTGVDANGNPTFALTKGKFESGVPEYTLGGRIDVNVNPVHFGIEAKRTGPRYLNDQNVDLIASFNGRNYGNKSPAYTVVNADARVNLGWAGLNDKTYVQFNVTNLFDVVYPGGFGGSLSATNDPFTYIGAPRTFSATLNVEF